ncbi:hypothetical protein N7509_013037 [Penicillium cosmopolitanum]|uniref:Uncharacterized protein n=1 Tax=Penicillium cosmopolitanum TaxID=1131564 RepID=A0A9W9VE79_9EURO|nr:uncharacterized protein N7509_013037 [Penicillium cosmopolitanum]KAJ5376151.1 hypothetical protein N7509_013037 [Penicillium cosmopolitanum]
MSPQFTQAFLLSPAIDNCTSYHSTLTPHAWRKPRDGEARKSSRKIQIYLSHLLEGMVHLLQKNGSAAATDHWKLGIV